MTNDVCQTLEQYINWAKNGSQKNTRELSTVPFKGLRESVAIYVHGPLQTTNQGNQYVTVMVDRVFKLTRAVANAKASATKTANFYLKN